MPTVSIEKNRNLESAIPKKGSAQSFASRRQKAPPGAASPKKQLRSVGSKPARATGAERSPKADEPPIERIIRQKSSNDHTPRKSPPPRHRRRLKHQRVSPSRSACSLY